MLCSTFFTNLATYISSECSLNDTDKATEPLNERQQG